MAGGFQKKVGHKRTISISIKEATRHGSGKGQSGMNRTKETDTTKETEWSDSTKKKNQELRQDKENLEMNQIILQQKKEMPSSKWGTVQK